MASTPLYLPNVRPSSALSFPRFLGGPDAWLNGSRQKETRTVPTPSRYPPELRQRAVGLVLSSGQPIAQIAAELGINRETLRTWVRQAQADRGQRTDLLSTDERQELKRLRKELAELRRANEILKAASAWFAQELDPTRRRS
jgi:transposase